MGKVPKTVQLKPVRLAVEVADRTGLTLRESEAAIDAVFAVIQDSLRSGLSVRLPKVGLLCTVLRYDSRWLNAGQPWAVKPAKRVEFRANQHFFREKRHRHPLEHLSLICLQ